jgi:hypothetical protein
MSTKTLIPRTISVCTSEIPRYINFLEEYIGKAEVINRLEQITRIIQIENGAYLHYWLLPNLAFWIGLHETRQQVKTISSSLEKTVEIAAKLQALYYSMPNRVIDDFRARILKADYLSPIFFEIDVAAHFWQLGYEIEWAEPAKEPGVHIPEFTITDGDNKIEIECKSKRADAGRKILRPNFYKLVDEIASPISMSGYTGRIDIVVPDRMPVNVEWKKQVSIAINQLLSASVKQTKLSDGTEVKINIHKVGRIVIPANKVAAEAQRKKYPYSHLAIFTKKYGKALMNPLIFELRSQSNDRILENIFDNLKYANHQFTGDNPSMICCFVPEIDSFSGLEQDSDLIRMTATFFERHANPAVFAVAYSSDPVRIVTPMEITKLSPAIRIDNPFYDEKLGPRIRAFQ